ncbi:lipopolysaccharide heptosyltransferase II [Candidatus Sumerlaeota bacterium]|nr:lipopolysaccharide heptosyltransferase II [Candidatus Sumerlaeota bacterium]
MSFDKIVIKSTNWVGDTILTTPSIRLLRRQFPKARIVAIARQWVADLLVDNPDIDELWIENKLTNPLSFLRLAHRMRSQRFDLGISFPNSFVSALTLWAGGVRYRIGYDRDHRGWLLSERIKVTDRILRVHQVEYYLNLLRPICDVDNAERNLVLPVNEQVAKEVKEFLLNRDIDLQRNRPLIGINPGAFYGSAKRWLPERYAVVADYIQQKHNATVIVTGIAQERPIAEEVISGTKSKNIHNLAGEVSLRQLIALLSFLDLYITNDSGAMHIASAVGTPVVAIFGSTDWVTTAPYSQKAVIVRKETECAPCLLRECPGDHRCMTAIQAEDVINAVEEQLHKYFYT